MSPGLDSSVVNSIHSKMLEADVGATMLPNRTAAFCLEHRGRVTTGDRAVMTLVCSPMRLCDHEEETS